MKPNKEQVYIRLIEGAIVEVPVKTNHLENNIFEIIENGYLDLNTDVTSIWEFFPGDIVKCEKIGNELIAKELINSNFPNRRVHQLIFIIVEKAGNIQPKDLEKFSEEIEQLVKGTNIIQKKHPIIQSWLRNNFKAT